MAVASVRPQAEGMADQELDFTGLRAMFINCTLKRSPGAEPHRRGWSTPAPRSCRSTACTVEVCRAVDHDIATGVYPDMTEHGWASDEWPDIYPRVLDSDILVIAGPIWLGDNSSVTKKVIERLYACSAPDSTTTGSTCSTAGSAGCLITGNEDGIKHCAQNILYSPAAHRLHDPAAGRRRLDRRGRARARRTSTPAAAARRTTSPTATPRS